VILIAAVVVGALAAYSLYSWQNGIQDRAYDHAARVRVYKVAKDIAKGDFGDDAFSKKSIVVDEIPKEFRPATAITDPSQIRGKVALAPLSANQVVVAGQFVDPAASTLGFSSSLTNNEVAVTVSVDQVRGVAGLLVPGDEVNILVAPQADGAKGAFAQPARFMYQKVQILAVGQTRKLEPGESAPADANGQTATAGSGLITFAVPAEAAQRIASADPSSLYLTLVPKDYVPKAIGPVNQDAPFPGEDPSELTPYGPEA
jgi:pilus assembly protein CpaB